MRFTLRKIDTIKAALYIINKQTCGSQMKNSVHQPGIHSENIKESGHYCLCRVLLRLEKVRCLKGYGAIS